MGMQPSEFYDLTLEEFSAIHKGYVERESRAVRQSWEIGRMIAYYTFLPHVRKGKKLEPSDIIEFEWEAKERKKRLEDMKKMDLSKVFPKMLKNGKDKNHT